MKNKNIKLLLISLRDPFLDNDRVMPPIGIMALHSYMLNCGFDSTIENDFSKISMDRYSEFSHVGISCMTPQKDQAIDILKEFKKTYPFIKIIIGGPHAKFYLNDCLKEDFDHIVIGDGEFALEKILKGEIPSSQRIVDIQMDEAEMNSMPLPYRAPSFLNQYNFFIQGVKSTTIMSAKGCPMKCAFCEDAGTNVRLYRPSYIGKQIEQSKNAGYEGVMFFDDIFALSLKRVRELSQEIIKHNIYYRCFGHARNMCGEMAALLSESGCIEMGFGAESGSQKILDVVGKKTTVAQNLAYVDICNSHAIRVKAFLIIGLPGEDRETIKETELFVENLLSKKFLNKFGKQITNDFDLTIYFPYKGTAIRDSIDAKRNEFDLCFEKDPDLFYGFYKGKNGSAEAMVRTSALNCEEIVELKDKIFNKYKKYVVN